LERAAQRAEQEAKLAQGSETADLPTPTANADGTIAQPENPASPALAFQSRDAAIAAQPRVTIDTASLIGSINLVGARIDDLELKGYRETIDPDSPIISLLSPSIGPAGYYIDQGWQSPEGASVDLPGAKSEWAIKGNATLTATSPVTLTFDNGAGLLFKRTFSVDENYLFTVTQSVENQTSAPVSLFPYSRIARNGTPELENFFILHEGAIGVLGDDNLVEKGYGDLETDQQINFDSKGGWLGFVDKYWATAVLPAADRSIKARMSSRPQGSGYSYQTNFIDNSAVTIPASGSGDYTSYVFAGAKVESVIDSYEKEYGFDRVELLIDWGWFHFLTKPMFYVIRILNGFLGNFGLAILAVTVLVKALFFPLANRSYASMAAMRRVQPEMKALQERFKDDKPEQQKAMMELYKREKINPISGCWPVLIQIPVFFSLYKVLFVTIEMRHAPFFGWIQDLAAQDPTNVFNLFGLLPYDPTALPMIGSFLAIGVWPVLMGITMWVQMKLNPPPTDPSQAMIFGLMPILFTFMLGTFPAGLVIYWAWNNFLSVLQQYTIMKRHGVDVNLFENIVNSFKRKPADEKPDK
jgi:YidC/Oxa1 family membrane protein insertase